MDKDNKSMKRGAKVFMRDGGRTWYGRVTEDRFISSGVVFVDWEGGHVRKESTSWVQVCVDG